MPSQPSIAVPDDRAFAHPEACLFQIEHRDAVIRIADDWDGHVLIEKLYVALREARQARDKASLLKRAGPGRADR